MLEETEKVYEEVFQDVQLCELFDGGAPQLPSGLKSSILLSLWLLGSKSMRIYHPW